MTPLGPASDCVEICPTKKQSPGFQPFQLHPTMLSGVCFKFLIRVRLDSSSEKHLPLNLQTLCYVLCFTCFNLHGSVYTQKGHLAHFIS